MTERNEKYGLVRGFLLAHHAPAEVLEALEEIGLAVRQEIVLSGGGVLPGLSDPLVAQAGHGGRTDTPPCERVSHAKLTPEDAPAVREMAAVGKSQNAIALHFQVSQPTVSAFMRKHGIKTTQRAWGARGGTYEQTPLPGEAVSVVDEHGRTVTKLPPGYAHGVAPEPSAKGAGGY